MKAFLLFVIVTSFYSCKKFLDARPNNSLAIPKTVQDLQALLDAHDIISNGTSYGIAEGSGDNYYLPETIWQSITSEESRSIYLWGEEIFYNSFPNEWSKLYQVINVSNTVLESLHDIESSSSDMQQRQQVEGSALFYRARSYLTLVSNWGLVYQLPASNTDLGVPLRLSSDFNIPSQRATVAQCYDQIVNDLQRASQLLPAAVPHVMRPSKPAAFALLARTYLWMDKYGEAREACDSSLRYFSQLLNYNEVDSNSFYSFSQYNKEVIFHSVIAVPPHLDDTRAAIDSNLYSSYEIGDLRKVTFFEPNGDGTYRFKGSYNGSWILFDGIATDEVLLTRAECYARLGDLAKAATDLNTLLRNRYETGFYTDYSSSDQNEMVSRVLTERRKELLMRNIRWGDIKRLNKEPMYQTTIKRIIDGQEYILAPNDKKYALPLPAYIVTMTGMPQNQR
ncbi:MAG: RagB/SusD family nutrient uptake outer membrane protein [Chitinophagaceae bacterium]|nr:MAG: RagB/SusD family nutrient uptake outer membrane protein [Chitinophagaceae bacterium]